jgi:L-fuconate dehydratase
VRVAGGRYHLPQASGYAAMTPAALAEYRFPDGPAWTAAGEEAPATLRERY